MAGDTSAELVPLPIAFVGFRMPQAARRRVSTATTTTRGRVFERAHRTVLIGLLNDCLANEICCVLLYSRRQFLAIRQAGGDSAAQFQQNLSDEQSHADRIAVRIVELGGELECQDKILDSIEGLPLHQAETESDLIRATLAAEQWSIDTYLQVLSHIGDTDPVTRNLVDEILATEMRHAHDLTNLLPGSAPAEPLGSPQSSTSKIAAAD
ncbi:MAG: ferritin-like domain-containing protein [Betaproteobacteria bacterium]